ncbi:MAG: hypothetical protein ACUVSL_02470 [Chloroflexus sp.]|uniref:hypothetical protein n=1 Tax=Chloroflexus sp. TaxID=1904827 RepID=UPI00404B525C
MPVANHIEKVRERLRRGEFPSEAAVSQGVVLPSLHELGWPVFDTNVVIPEYSVEGRRVDFALCHPVNRRPLMFIEVKKVGISDGADRQLFEYAFLQGVPMAIFTNGQEWNFYLPGEQGRYDERRVYKLDLLERDIEESVYRLERYLQYERVCSGEALKAARSDYQNVARAREIEAALPKAWKSLLEEPDSLLLELLADKVEDLCGYKPDLDVCSRFITTVMRKHVDVPPQYPTLPRTRNPLPAERIETDNWVRAGSECFIMFEGKTYKPGSAIETMLKLFQLLAEADPGFLDRFAAMKHGSKRKYIARNSLELYPDRPDLAKQCSVEIIPGWWMGKNYSKSNIKHIIEMALGIVSPTLRAKIQYEL